MPETTMIWAEIAKQGFSILIMGTFAYVCYMYFSKKSKEDWDRFDKEKADYHRIIAEKDDKIEDNRQQLLEMTKLNIESWANMMSSINNLAQKIDKLK